MRSPLFYHNIIMVWLIMQCMGSASQISNIQYNDENIIVKILLLAYNNNIDD